MIYLYTIVLLLSLLFPNRTRADLPPPVTPSVEEIIKEDAHLYKVDPNLAIAIATCESRLKPNAQNPESTAKGIYQFLDSSWQYYGEKHWGVLQTRDVFNPSDNIELAMWVMGNYGTNDWLASKGCWER